MKIVFFSRLFYPHIGGVEKHVMELSKILIKKGFNVTVITEAHEKNLNAKEVILGINIIRLNISKEGWFKKFSIWKEIWKYRKIILAADIIHCHDVFFWYLPFRILYPYKKVFTTFHGHENYPISNKSIGIRKLSEKLSYGSLIVGECIKKWYKANPTCVIFGAISPLSNVEFQEVLIEKKIKIYLVGRLDADRGVGTYLNILKNLKKRKISYEFKAFGDGPFKTELKKYGTISNFVKDIEKQILDADIIFASSYLSILEAIQLKKLVVAVHENPLKKDCLEQTPFTKFIIVSNNASDIVKKIQYFKQNKAEKDNMLADGYNWVSLQTWYKLFNIYLDLWNISKT